MMNFHGIFLFFFLAFSQCRCSAGGTKNAGADCPGAPSGGLFFLLLCLLRRYHADVNENRIQIAGAERAEFLGAADRVMDLSLRLTNIS